jgi:hypothetical protein
VRFSVRLCEALYYRRGRGSICRGRRGRSGRGHRGRSGRGEISSVGEVNYML